MKKLTIATRQSPLALWQANFIKAQLQMLYPDITIVLLELVTKGDKILDAPLAKIGGKGLFVKELETALLTGQADIAVHSLKDVPMVLPEGLMIGAYCERHSPFDAFVSNHFDSLSHLPKGARVGTSSLRRECQLKAHRSDLEIISLRGNVGTRLAKLDAGEYDAIILAQSGLERLGLNDRIRHSLTPEVCLPAVGQGTLAIECCTDKTILSLIKPLNDEQSALRAISERAMNERLEGGCQVPIAGFATFENKQLTLEGRVGSIDGKKLLRVIKSTPCHTADEAKALGISVADDLLAQGADAILKQIYQTP